MGKTVLEVSSLTKTIKNKPIISDVAFSIQEGEILGLLGPNGAGKTTIIRMLTGLVNKQEGMVSIDNHLLDDNFEACMTNVGAIIENPEFYKYMTGYQNLKQFARMSRKKITDKEIAQIVETVHLTEAINQKVKTYSLGMRQRLGIAQALLHQPKLLILDEPLNGLDPEGMRDFRNLMKQLAKNGMAILISSHLLSEMELVADRIAILEKGVLTHISSLNETMDESNTEITLTIESPDQSLLQKQIAILGYSAVNVKGNFLTIEINRDHIAELVHNLVYASVPILGVVPQSNTLEERFLSLTSGGGLK